jgi:(p)ppGpp synthase/HD superfamily hydrolase
MPSDVSAAIAALPLKEMEASLLRSAILEHVMTLGLSEPDFREAIDIASFLHREQTRKQRGSMHLVHYIEHPLRNTLRALRYGVADADTLISIVLHDTVEDAPHEFSAVFAGHEATAELDAREHALGFLADRFGLAVAQIVRGLSNPLLPAGLSRTAKNRAYIDHVRTAIDSPQVFVAKFVDFADNALSLHHSMDRGFVKRQAIKYRPLVALFAARLGDDDVQKLVGPQVIARMTRQLEGNRLAEFSTAEV